MTQREEFKAWYKEVGISEYECTDEQKDSLFNYSLMDDEMKVKIVQQELKEDGILTTYSNGHVEMLPYLIDENGDEYVEMFPNDIEQH